MKRNLPRSGTTSLSLRWIPSSALNVSILIQKSMKFNSFNAKVPGYMRVVILAFAFTPRGALTMIFNSASECPLCGATCECLIVLLIIYITGMYVFIKTVKLWVILEDHPITGAVPPVIDKAACCFHVVSSTASQKPGAPRAPEPSPAATLLRAGCELAAVVFSIWVGTEQLTHICRGSRGTPLPLWWFQDASRLPLDIWSWLGWLTWILSK